MKFRNRFLALVATCALAVVTLLTSAAPAFADDLTSTSTANVSLGDLGETVDVTAWRVIDVNWDDASHQPKDPQWVWADEVAQWVEDNGPDYIDANNDGVTKAFSEMQDSAKKAFFDELAAALKAGDPQLTPVRDNYECSGDLGELEMGEYVVVVENSDENVYGTYAVAVEPKFNKDQGVWTLEDQILQQIKRTPLPTEKTHEDGSATGTAGIGDTISFKTVTAVPNYPANATRKELWIGDLMSTGLTFDEASVKVYGMASKDDNGTLLNETTYDLVIDDAAAPNDDAKALTFLVKFADASKLYDAGYKYVKVTYTATLNEDAFIGSDGNTNEAFGYWTDPYNGNWHETGDKTTDYTFGIKVLKYDGGSADKAPLTGAEFTLSEKGGEPLSFVEVGTGEGVYRLAKKDEEGASTKLVVAEADGRVGMLTLKGLDEGTYTLTETKAPDGFNIGNPTDITIVAKKDEQGDYTGEVTMPFGDEIGYVGAEVKNNQGFTLPTTGGVGTALFAAAGVVLAGGGFALYRAATKRSVR